MKTENFKHYFSGNKQLMPKDTDLSYYHWEAQKTRHNDSPNFKTDASSENGLLFRNRRDRKVIYVNPELDSPGDNTTRSEVYDN